MFKKRLKSKLLPGEVDSAPRPRAGKVKTGKLRAGAQRGNIMKIPGKAHGNVARQANKQLRRQRILEHAAQLMASEGIEAFTINRLASETGVSTPTIHNLFGKKNDIAKELVSNLIEQMEGIHTSPPSEPIENTKFFVGNLVALFEQNTSFYRAAFMAAEQLGLFDPKLPNGLFQRALKVATPRNEWYESGLLLGNIERSTMMERVHNSNRLGRLDWVSGYIDLNQYRHHVVESILLVYAADASPEFHVRLCEEINRLKGT